MSEPSRLIKLKLAAGRQISQAVIASIELGHFDIHLGQFGVLANRYLVGRPGISAIKTLCCDPVKKAHARQNKRQCTEKWQAQHHHLISLG